MPNKPQVMVDVCGKGLQKQVQQNTTEADAQLLHIHAQTIHPPLSQAFRHMGK